MAYNFSQAENAFRNNLISELAQDPNGLRFLKLRSLSRAEYMRRLIHDCQIPEPNISSKKLLRFLFESNITTKQIHSTINSIYSEQRKEREENENKLVSELYKLKVFDWGGLHQNSLERTIIDNYVKKIRSFNTLCDSIENELHHSMKSYVLCSWYNHWTSIIIEDVFKDHPVVLPAVGLIKKVDFFISDTPFDLKVTYLPEGFIKDKRREDNLRPELTILKRFCRNQQILFDRSLPEARLLEDLWAKVKDYPVKNASILLQELKQKRLEILQEAMDNPKELIKWLYENQGVRRFDASNRLFLVLIDRDNFFDSWKFKRAKPLLIDTIHRHLSNIGDKPGYKISFEWEGQTYTANSEVIFLTHNAL